MKQYINILFSLFLVVTLFSSCESLLEVSPEEVLLTEDYLGNDKIDARSALFGVLGEMQDIVGQYIILGEMRADLVDVTGDTEDDIRQINRHEVSSDNSYADLTSLFSIINNCNFALEGIDTEAYEGELLEDYASILRVRTWAQLQIIINFGKLPYITTPIFSDDDLEETYPLLSFEDGLDTLIANLEAIIDVENVDKYENSLGYSIFDMIPDNDILLGDLYLWQGHYVLSATHYKKFLDKHVLDGGNLYNLTSQYGVEVTENGDSYNVDSSGWLNIFDDNIQQNEVINYIPFDDEYRQPNSSFLVVTTQIKPSNAIILKWANQFIGFEREATDLNFDPRAENSMTSTDGIERIGKYQYEYFVWNRAAKIYLRYAEAINYAGYPDYALAIVNGIFNNPLVGASNAPIFNNVQKFLDFDMEQYYTVNSSNVPTSGNLGIRGRAGLAPVSIDENLTVTERPEAIRQTGVHILNEAALELAFEGNRWEDLLRFAKRANNPAILADAVANKFEASGDVAGAAAIKQKLTNPENWYLPLDIPDNFVGDN